ncbi:Uncharacterised protein [Orientia tsutsugamushi]|nr:Uncharacterised protein [Orientia tsutsugamushi]
MKLSGKRNTGNPYVTFDVACDGNWDNYTTVPSLEPTYGTGMWQHFFVIRHKEQYQKCIPTH